VKILNSAEIKNVSGGVDQLAALWVLSAANLLFGLYNLSQISEQNETLDSLIVLTIYQEAQLRLLPNYAEVTALSFSQAVGQAFS